MLSRETHTKQDEWVYTATKKNARRKIKRSRSKSKRVYVKKMIKEICSDDDA